MTHSFNTELAKMVGVNEALLFQDLCESTLHERAVNKLDEKFDDAWIRRSDESFHAMYPYMSDADIAKAIRHLEDEGLIKVEKAFALTLKGEEAMKSL